MTEKRKIATRKRGIYNGYSASGDVDENYCKYIIKNTANTLDNFRKCKKIYTEILDHIRLGYSVLAGSRYTQKHVIVAKIIHKEIKNNLNLADTTTPYYQYTPIYTRNNT